MKRSRILQSRGARVRSYPRYASTRWFLLLHGGVDKFNSVSLEQLALINKQDSRSFPAMQILRVANHRDTSNTIFSRTMCLSFPLSSGEFPRNLRANMYCPPRSKRWKGIHVRTYLCAAWELGVGVRYLGNLGLESRLDNLSRKYRSRAIYSS